MHPCAHREDGSGWPPAKGRGRSDGRRIVSIESEKAPTYPRRPQQPHLAGSHPCSTLVYGLAEPLTADDGRWRDLTRDFGSAEWIPGDGRGEVAATALICPAGNDWRRG